MEQISQIEKRKRGRPHGSKNKRKADAERKRLLRSAAEKVSLDVPISEAEACAYFSVARLTLARLRQAQTIRFYKIGDRIMYSPSQLRADLERRAKAA